ncbi:MAG: hypothetical protein OHK0029_35640 [Armatimonadaceae bacterium]
MPKPFDATTKQLVEMGPGDWLRLFDVPGEQAEVMDADLATVTTEADRVLRVHHPESIVHFEFESGHRGAETPRVLLRYNVLLAEKYRLPVRNGVILLRSASDSPALNGELEFRHPDDSVYLSFRYNVVRVWELETERVLAGGLATLPLAPLTRLNRTELPGVVQQMQTRIQTEAGPQQERELWAATYILMGLNYPTDFTNQLLQGVLQMRDSSTYQAILLEGEIKGEIKGELIGIRETILRQGRKRFGEPSPENLRTLDKISSAEKLGSLAELLLEVESWEELLAER